MQYHPRFPIAPRESKSGLTLMLLSRNSAVTEAVDVL